MIERMIAQRVIEDLAFMPVVGLLGPRQVGKTTLAKMIQRVGKTQCILTLKIRTH